MRPHERFDSVPNKHFGSKLQRSIERGYYSHHSLSRALWLIIPSVMVADLTGGYSRFQVTAELLSGWLSPKLACAARALGSRSHVRRWTVGTYSIPGRPGISASDRNDLMRYNGPGSEIILCEGPYRGAIE